MQSGNRDRSAGRSTTRWVIRLAASLHLVDGLIDEEELFAILLGCRSYSLNTAPLVLDPVSPLSAKLGRELRLQTTGTFSRRFGASMAGNFNGLAPQRIGPWPLCTKARRSRRIPRARGWQELRVRVTRRRTDHKEQVETWQKFICSLTWIAPAGLMTS